MDLSHLNTTTIASTESIREGNEQLREAMRKNAGFRVFVLFFITTLAFVVLFLDWYNGWGDKISLFIWRNNFFNTIAFSSCCNLVCSVILGTTLLNFLPGYPFDNAYQTRSKYESHVPNWDVLTIRFALVWSVLHCHTCFDSKTTWDPRRGFRAFSKQSCKRCSS